MNFFKIIFITLYFLFAAFSAQADNHDKDQTSEQNIIEKAKEINLKVGKLGKFIFLRRNRRSGVRKRGKGDLSG